MTDCGMREKIYGKAVLELFARLRPFVSSISSIVIVEASSQKRNFYVLVLMDMHILRVYYRHVDPGIWTLFIHWLISGPLISLLQ